MSKGVLTTLKSKVQTSVSIAVHVLWNHYH